MADSTFLAIGQFLLFERCLGLDAFRLIELPVFCARRFFFGTAEGFFLFSFTVFGPWPWKLLTSGRLFVMLNRKRGLASAERLSLDSLM